MNFKFLDHKIIAAAQSDLDINHQFSKLTELLTHPCDYKKKHFFEHKRRNRKATKNLFKTKLRIALWI